MVVILTFSFGLVIYRLPLLQGAQRARLVGVARGGVPGQQLDSAVLGVLRPVRDDVPDAERGGHRRAAHRGRAVLQQVDGADRPHPAVPDRRRPAARVAQVDADEPARSVPVARWRLAVVTAGALRGARHSASGRRACASRCARSSSARSCRSSGAARNDPPQEHRHRHAARRSIGLVGRNKRRYGGYIVHVGIVLIFLGFAGNGFKQDEQVLLKPGEETTIGRYTIRNDGVKVSDDGQKQMIDGVPGGVRRRQADRHAVSGEVGASASTRASRRPRSRSAARSPRTCTSCSARQPSARGPDRRRLQIVVNPLVNWIWFGFGIMALGTGIALLPERAFSFALAKLPAEAAATTTALSLLLAMLLFGGTTLSAQQGMGGAGRSEHPVLVLRAQRRSRSSCSTRSSAPAAPAATQTIAECRKDPCGTSHEMRGRARRAASTRARPTTRSSRRSSPSTAARRCSARRSTRASTGWRGCSRIWSAPPAPSRSASPR